MSINRVEISGNLTRDPELKQTQSGSAILRFGVAVNDRRKNGQTGEWEDYPNFIDCVMWGNRANAMSRILTRGMKVALAGRLHYSSWEKDGQKRSRVEIYVDEVEFMSSRNGQQAQQRPQQQPYVASAPAPAAMPAAQTQPVAATPEAPAPAAPASAPVQAPPSDDVYDEDIPF